MFSQHFSHRVKQNSQVRSKSKDHQTKTLNLGVQNNKANKRDKVDRYSDLTLKILQIGSKCNPNQRKLDLFTTPSKNQYKSGHRETNSPIYAHKYNTQPTHFLSPKCLNRQQKVVSFTQCKNYYNDNELMTIFPASTPKNKSKGLFTKLIQQRKLCKDNSKGQLQRIPMSQPTNSNNLNITVMDIKSKQPEISPFVIQELDNKCSLQYSHSADNVEQQKREEIEFKVSIRLTQYLEGNFEGSGQLYDQLEKELTELLLTNKQEKRQFSSQYHNLPQLLIESRRNTKAIATQNLEMQNKYLNQSKVHIDVSFSGDFQ